MAPIQEISFRDFELERETGEWQVIDVREAWEYEAAHLPEAIHFSLGDIMRDRDEAAKKIDWTKKVLFVCRSGGRSMQAALLMGRYGESIYNLEGGVNAIFRRDPTALVGDTKDMERYFA